MEVGDRGATSLITIFMRGYPPSNSAEEKVENRKGKKGRGEKEKKK